MKKNLSENETRVLSFFLENSRITDSEIARRIGLSVAAVSKIRRKLEKRGIIQGYKADIDFKLVGINYFSLVLYQVNQKWWKHIGMDGTKELFKNSPHILYCARYHEADVSLIALYGFRDAEESTDYFNQVQEKYLGYLQIQKMFCFPINNMVKNSSADLVYHVINTDKSASPRIEQWEKMVELSKQNEKK